MGIDRNPEELKTSPIIHTDELAPEKLENIPGGSAPQSDHYFPCEYCNQIYPSYEQLKTHCRLDHDIIIQ